MHEGHCNTVTWTSQGSSLNLSFFPFARKLFSYNGPGVILYTAICEAWVVRARLRHGMCNTAAPDFTTRQCGPGSSLTLHFIHSASARNILSVTGARNANLGAEFIKKNIGWFKSIELSTGCPSVRTIVVICSWARLSHSMTHGKCKIFILESLCLVCKVSNNNN